MAAKVGILLPIGERIGVHQTRLSPRLDSVKGKRIAILYNNWQAMDYIVKEYSSLLVDEYGAKEAYGVAMPVSLPMPEAQMDEVMARSDAAIVGLAT